MVRALLRILYRAAQLVLLALLVYGFAQTLTLDVALLLAGDTLLYFEIAAAVFLAAQVTRLKWALTWIRFVVEPQLHWLRSRARRGVRAVRSRLIQPPPDEEDRSRGALVFA